MVLSVLPPCDACNSCSASTCVPRVIFLVTSTTRFFSARLITLAIHSSDHTRKQQRPRPAVSLTLSRKARQILLGYAAHPSVHTNRAHASCEHARTFAIMQSAKAVSRLQLTSASKPSGRSPSRQLMSVLSLGFHQLGHERGPSCLVR